MMMMGEYFRFTTEFKNFMFEHVDIHGTTGIFAACVVMFLLTILLEAMKAVVMYIHLRLTQNPLTYGRTNISINHDRSPLFSALMIPSSMTEIRRQRIRLHIAAFFSHTLNVILGYFIMLAVMSYDAYIFVAVIVGTGLGYYIFGAINLQNQMKYAALKNSVYERYDSQAALNNDSIDT